MKDINPQLIRGEVISSANDTFTENVTATPLVAEAGLVMEILKVFMQLEFVNPIELLVGGDLAVGSLRDRASLLSPPRIGQTGVIATFKMNAGVVTNGANGMNMIVEYDLTDSNGNGMLYGKRDIFATVDSVGAATEIILSWAILYRLKKVNATELVGLMAE